MNNKHQGFSSKSIHDADPFVIVLSEEEREAIVSIAEEFPPLDVRMLDDSNLLTRLEIAKGGVPDRISRTLYDFRRSSNDFGTLLIRNLVVDERLPNTPIDGRASLDKTTSISECSILLMMLHLGEPIAYADEKDGAIIQNICPIRGREGAQENAGSVFLEFHTENGFHPAKPDYVGLICLRSDHDRVAQTATASIRRALHLLPDDTVQLLRQPLYQIRFAASFVSAGQRDSGRDRKSPSMPVLSGDSIEPEICVDVHAMTSDDPAAQAALDCLTSALMQVVVGTILLPGDLMIVDNRVAAHARTAFRPRYDGQDRWLQRLFVVQDFRRSRAIRPHDGHVCKPLTD